MGFPDDVLTHIDEIESLLRELQQDACCAPVDVTDGGIYTDTIEDGIGSVPQEIIDAGYVTDANDWTGFAAYKCMIANVAVDTIIRRLREFEALFDSTGDDFLGPFGAIVAILGFIAASVLTGGAALVVGIIGGLGAATSIWGYLTEFTESQVGAMANAITGDVRDALVCAIVDADGSDAATAAFKAAVGENFTALETAFINNLNIGPTIKALYSGRYDQQDVAAQLGAQGFVTSGYTCECEEPYDFDETFTFDADAEGWTIGGTSSSYDATLDCLSFNSGASSYGSQDYLLSALRTRLGISSSVQVRVDFLSFDFWKTQGVATTQQVCRVRVYNNHNLQSWTGNQVPTVPTSFEYDTSGVADLTAVSASGTLKLIDFEGDFSVSNGATMKVDNVRIAGTLI